MPQSGHRVPITRPEAKPWREDASRMTDGARYVNSARLQPFGRTAMNEPMHIPDRCETTDTLKPWSTPALTVFPVDQAENLPTLGDDGLGFGS